MNKELLKKYLTNNFTGEELEEALNWFNREGLSEDGKKFGFDEWESYVVESHSENEERFTELFDKIQRRINENNYEKEAYPKPKQKIFSIQSFTNWLTRAAAILLIPVLAILFYTLSEHRTELAGRARFAVDSLEVIAPVGSQTVVQLSDGSKVHLNYGSKLKYPQIFSGSTRDVILSGEGYFEVAHSPEIPFIVHVGEWEVKAVGTEFNILAYPDDDVFETTLVKGKVILEQETGKNEIKTIGAMKPGQHVQYNLKTNKILSSYASVEKYIAWKDGKLTFEDKPIKAVAEKLNRMFNVDIEVDKDIEDYIYTVTFVNEPLFQILDLMAIATPISYKAFARKKLPDGRFSKQKIIISKK